MIKILPGSYIFSGHNAITLQKALLFAKQLQVSEFDLHIIEPVKSDAKNNTSESLKIEQIREIQKILSLKPYSSKYKFIIIQQAHLMTNNAANAFLKTLEEPPKNSIIVLLTKFQYLLLPTIVSRCHILYFSKPILANVSKPNTLEYKNLETWMLYWREKMIRAPSKKYLQILQKTLEIYKLLQTANINQQLALNFLSFIYEY